MRHITLVAFRGQETLGQITVQPGVSGGLVYELVRVGVCAEGLSACMCVISVNSTFLQHSNTVVNTVSLLCLTLSYDNGELYVSAIFRRGSSDIESIT